VPEPWRRPVLAVVLGITGLRVLLLAFDRVPLWVDEAQYWQWGQDLAFGYYSKPPLIGWLLGLMSLTCGDTTFCIRLPGPLLHGATALILAAAAARWWAPRAALPVAAGYLTLPMAAIGSLQMATDSLMAPLLALAFAGWLACTLGQAGRRTAFAAGAAVGIAFLAKYAAGLYLPCALLAWLVLRPRPSVGHLLALFAGFLAAASPNLLWNLAVGLPTLSHTLDDSGWAREAGLSVHPLELASFLVQQAAFVGPVVFGGLVWLAAGWHRRPPRDRLALAFSLPILGFFCLQALLSHALVNWAAAAYLAATVAVLARLPRPWRIASFALNGTFCLALPLLSLAPERLWIGDRPLLDRYLGRAEVSAAILATARAEGLTTVVASDRSILADLFHTARHDGLTLRAVPPTGRPTDHYQFRYPFDPATPGDVLLVTRADRDPPCGGAVHLADLRPDSGAFRDKPQSLWRLPPGCLSR
jgi:4-amino-4-deoxy-L-arabinose transferase-like glycosyltransferase